MVRVLIIDDSSVVRRCVVGALMGQPGIEVIGSAANGKLALDKIADADVAVLDMEMPEMNGLEVLDEVARLGLKVQIIVFASATKSSALASLKALNRGAFDFVLKPENGGNEPQKIRDILVPKIYAAADKTLTIHPIAAPEKSELKTALQSQNFNAVVIGSSTGGPNALEAIFQDFSVALKIPIFIVQHMPPIFTAALAERIKTISGNPAKEAEDGEIVKSGHIYVAPGDYHMRVVRENDKTLISLNQNAKRHSVRPAVDELFESAAEVYGKNLLGTILTGMGDDGRSGAQRIKATGGAILLQERNSCVVWGMPRAVFESGAFDLQGDLQEIRTHLKKVAA